jgi:hypothetical protein
VVFDFALTADIGIERSLARRHHADVAAAAISGQGNVFSRLRLVQTALLWRFQPIVIATDSSEKSGTDSHISINPFIDFKVWP